MPDRATVPPTAPQSPTRTEATLRRAQRAARIAYVVERADGGFDEASDTFAELAGDAPEPPARALADWLARIHPDDREPLATAMTQARARRAGEALDYRVRHGVDWIDVHHVMEATDDGGWFHTLQDVSRWRGAIRPTSTPAAPGAVASPSLKAELERAVAAHEFVLHYQPIASLRTGHVVGAEALIRWQHPLRGLLSPRSFLAVAEALDLTIPIGEWALRAACKEAQRWRERGWEGIAISVNLSARQFRDEALAQRVADALTVTGLDPDMLTLEFTEDVVMQDAQRCTAKLHALTEQGVRLALDDLGTGYSSLSYLKRFHLNELKIDRSFIRDVTTSPDDAAIVRALLSLGQSLGLELVAEGVETGAQLAWLRGERCEKLQGHCFSPALAAEEFLQFIESRRQLPLPADTTTRTEATLLVVDDEPNIVAAVRRVLRREQCRVLSAASAAEAFALLAQHAVQVVISDHRMPVMTGAEFLGKVKALYPDTVRILFSGHVEVAALTEAVNRGAVYRFLLKPWDDEALRQSVRDAFRYYWLTHQARPDLPGAAFTAPLAR